MSMSSFLVLVGVLVVVGVVVLVGVCDSRWPLSFSLSFMVGGIVVAWLLDDDTDCRVQICASHFPSHHTFFFFLSKISL